MASSMMASYLVGFAACCLALVSSSPISGPHSLRGWGDPACPLSDLRDTSIWIDDSINRAIPISYMTKGSDGCVYGVIGGWTLPSGEKIEAVAKTKRRDVRSKAINGNEIDALTAIQELLGRGIAADGSEWIIIKFHQGNTVFDTTAWRKQYPHLYNTDGSSQGIADCQEFVRRLYHIIAEKQAWYVENYGWESHDIAWSNFLWNDDLTDVNIIDWGRAQRVDSRKSDEVYNAFMYALERKSEILIYDSTEENFPGRYRPIQGICSSAQRRVLFRSFENPLLPNFYTFYA